MRLLVTGGAGFIGSNFIHYWLGAHPRDAISNLDKLTYAGNPENLRSLEGNPCYRFLRGDVGDAPVVRRALRGVQAVVHFAAESHVDRSILDPHPFLTTNVLGVQVLLEEARRTGVDRFVQVSTDEVYGALGPRGTFSERSPLNPTSPYAASKAAADLLVLAYAKTFGVPAIVTRCSNNYGPYQFPEKLIPLMITNALEDRPLPVYGDGRQVRDWIHAVDHARAIERVLQKGRVGEVYNIGAASERTNLEVVRAVLRILGKPERLIRFVHDRPAHDRRYAIRAHKIRSELGWRPLRSFDEGLRETVAWYVEHRGWWERVKRGAYRRYYARQYGAR